MTPVSRRSFLAASAATVAAVNSLVRSAGAAEEIPDGIRGR